MPRASSRSVAERICFVSNSRSKCLASALYDSILDEDLNQIEFLLKHKRADPNYLLPELGITPVHVSVGCGSEDHAFKAVSFIVCYGGNPNVGCSEGTTPVSIAAVWGRLHILKLLLVHGGNPFICDDDGLNALDYAEQNNHVKVVSYLKSWKKCSGGLFPGSPCYTRSDAVTQTSTVSSVGCDEEISSSEEYVSCSEPCGGDVDPHSDRDLTLMLFPETVDKSLIQCDISTKDPPGNNDSKVSSLFERAFICENTSDLLSDIDSNIDLKDTVSIYNCDGHEQSSKYVADGFKQSLNVSNKEFEEILDKSCSSERFCCSDKVVDVAFVGRVPDAEEPIEELYTDDEAGIVLLQRNFPPSDSDQTVGTNKSSHSHCSLESYDTDNLANKLKECHIFSGPVTKTTKKVYARQLKRFVKSETADNKKCKYGVMSVLARTFSDNYLKLMEQWAPLEQQMSEEFIKNSTKYKFRGGLAKCFFNYLLLDPLVTNNLPQRVSTMNRLDVWKTFVEGIFYVGKGKQSRPYAHLYEALKPNPRKPPSKKVTRVLDIWNQRQGVVCLMIFHNIISAEALTREAAMIDVLEDGNLTNAQGGEYHGVAATWNMKQKCQLGAVLLHRALAIYLAEGERQISPPDLEARPNFH